MKLVISAAVLSVLSFSTLSATPEQIQFTGSVQLDSETPVVFDLHIPSKQSVNLQLADGSKLELLTPGNPESLDGARIRLIGPSGDVLHTANIQDPGLASTSFAYLVCAGQPTYMRPAPRVVPSCSTL